MKKNKKLLLQLLFVHLFFPKISLANTTNSSGDDFWHDTKINGDLRLYDFSRDFSNSGQPSQSAFSLGGGLNILSGQIAPDIRAGVTLYTAQGLGVNSDNPAHVYHSLPGNNITAVGQNFLQYDDNKFLLRAGNQLIDTPWLGRSDIRMIPATYQGFFSNYNFNKELSFSALRVFRFKSLIADSFSETNLYNETIPKFRDNTLGTLAFGMQNTDILNTQAWFYRFYDLANLAYANSSYTFSSSFKSLHPVIEVQVAREWGDGDNLLAPYAHGAANANMLGVLLGLESTQTKIDLSYNTIPKSTNGFRNGDILSPYTFSYSTDPLYTSSMLGGLVEKGAGQAIKLSGRCNLFDNKLVLYVSHANYFTRPYYNNTRETDTDVTYTFPKSSALKGLSLRNRLGLLEGDKTLGTVFDARIMIQYNF